MGDRNFDDLAHRFENRIYGGLKGKIRLSIIDAELDELLRSEFRNTSLSVLELGCGLAQHSIRLASLGHSVIANDISAVLLARAKLAAEKALVQRVAWKHGPFQSLELDHASQDLILCHALVEWVERPEQIFANAHHWLRLGGVLSLSFYNPDAKEYRNLIRGNFDWLQSSDTYQSDAGSLTPNKPCSYTAIEKLADEYGFSMISSAGIRVFSDYIVEKRGGLNDDDQVLKMELAYSRREPFKWLGRYIHVFLRRQ